MHRSFYFWKPQNKTVKKRLTSQELRDKYKLNKKPESNFKRNLKIKLNRTKYWMHDKWTDVKDNLAACGGAIKDIFSGIGSGISTTFSSVRTLFNVSRLVL